MKKYISLEDVSTIFILSLVLLLCISLFLCTLKMSNTEGFNKNMNKTMNTNIKDNIKNDKTVILLGDSVLKNNIYVNSGLAVDDHIKHIYKNTFNYAKDNAYIKDVYTQLNHIPPKYNNSSTYIVISFGGNDLIRMKETESVFIQYKKLYTTIKNKFPNTQKIILNLYYPPQSLSNNTAKTMIDNWNYKLKKYLTSSILDISTLLDNKYDFVQIIEPSTSGGKKIADAIINRIN